MYINMNIDKIQYWFMVDAEKEIEALDNIISLIERIYYFISTLK